MDNSIVPVNQIAVSSSSCYEFANPNEAEVVELEDEDIPVGIVEIQMDGLKLDHQFNEENVSQIFQFFVNEQMDKTRMFITKFYDEYCTIKCNNSEIVLTKRENDWLISYKNSEETIKTDEPEKFIVDHLWFVLKNPNIKLQCFRIDTYISTEKTKTPLDSEKINIMLQCMMSTFDHHIQIVCLIFMGFNEDTFLSMLRNIKALETICFDISWKEEGNYQKLKEIVQMDQWKQAKKILSCGVTPLRVEDLLHCKCLKIQCSSITPEDVLRVSELFLKFENSNECTLRAKKGYSNIDDIVNGLRSRNDGSIDSIERLGRYEYKIVKSGRHLILCEGEDSIVILKDKNV